MKSFEIVTTFRYKGRIMKLFNIRKVMVLVSVSIHEARVSSTFFGGLKASRRWKLKKIIILENIKSNELSLVFSKIVSKGLCCDKVWGISIFSSCTPIRGIYRKSLLNSPYMAVPPPLPPTSSKALRFRDRSGAVALLRHRNQATAPPPPPQPFLCMNRSPIWYAFRSAQKLSSIVWT